MIITAHAFLSNAQKQSVCDLWNQEYPQKLRYNSLTEFETYLGSLLDPQHYLLIDEQAEIAGWAVTFIREDQKWFAVIIKSSIHGKRYGTKLLNELKKNEHSLIGWVIDHEQDIKADGQPYHSPINFYLKNGFKVHQDQRLETEKISAVKIKWDTDTNEN